MPTARFFRLAVGDVSNTVLDISAVHLYNDNTRVDQNATLSSGFGLNATQLNVLKNDQPVDGEKITIDLATVRHCAAYVLWTFATAINVNAFRIGTGAEEQSFLNKLSLQYSDDGITYRSFVRISTDKKLFYPGPWQLTGLKPVGECYPFVMSKADQVIRNMAAGDATLRDNYSFKCNVNLKSGTQNIVWGASTVGMAVLLPGIFQSGKYYFEVSSTFKNSYSNAVGSSYLKYVLALPKDPTERLEEVRDSSLRGPSIALNHCAASNTNTAPSDFTYQKEYSPAISFKTYRPGVQHGLAIDFDNRNMKVVNPTYADVAPGIYDISNANIGTDMAAGDKVKAAIIINPTYGFYNSGEDMFLNFGQVPFANAVPAGYQSGFGPRWQEVPDTLINRGVDIGNINFSNPGDSSANGDITSFITSQSNAIRMREHNGGHYYIKGTISRDPNIQDKRFIARLFCHASGSFIDTCVASQSGIYEFYGIAYGLYSVFSVDVRNNTVTESIGPVYPKEIV